MRISTRGAVTGSAATGSVMFDEADRLVAAAADEALDAVVLDRFDGAARDHVGRARVVASAAGRLEQDAAAREPGRAEGQAPDLEAVTSG